MAQVLRDYYEVLGVQRDSDADEIGRAFRALAQELDPQVSREPDAAARFRELVEAYDVLSSRRSKLLYDRLGYRGLRSGGFVPGFRHGRPDERVVAAIELDFDRARNGTTATLRSTVTQPCARCRGAGAEPGTEIHTCERCGGRGRTRRRLERGGVHLPQLQICPDCRGTGHRFARPCGACSGSGEQIVERVSTVRVPPGVRSGERLHVEGIGDVVVRVRPRAIDRMPVRLTVAALLLAAIGVLVYMLLGG
jgi:molecular chaperone DnaJ